jgi:hypothetical protein
MLRRLDGRQVAENDAAPPAACDRRIVQRAKQGFLCLRQVPGLELGFAWPYAN